MSTSEISADDVSWWVNQKRDGVGPASWQDGLKLLKDKLAGVPAPHLYDVGASDGEFLKIARDEYGFTVGGNDILAGAVELARQRYGIDLDLGDLSTLHHEKIADAVTMWCVLAHTPEGEQLMRDVYRMLRPEGVVLLQTPHRTGADVAANAVQRMTRGRVSNVTDRRLGPHHLILHTRRSITTLLSRVGFVDIDVQPRARYSMRSEGYLGSLRVPRWAIPRLSKVMDRAIASPLAPRIVLDVTARKPAA